MHARNRFQVLLASLAPAVCGGVTSAAPGEMFPIDIVLIADDSMLCVSHVDVDGNPWFIAEIASIHPDLPEPPFEQGFEFRVTGQYCLSCVDVFCGSFSGFIFSANLVPVVEGDVNADGTVDILDLLDLLREWGPCPPDGLCPGDLDEDGDVGVSDLLILLANWA